MAKLKFEIEEADALKIAAGWKFKEDSCACDHNKALCRVADAIRAQLPPPLPVVGKRYKLPSHILTVLAVVERPGKQAVIMVENSSGNCYVIMFSSWIAEPTPVEVQP